MLRPVPIGTLVKRLRERADLAFVLRVAIEITRSGERARENIGRIDRGDLTLARATPGLHVEEVIIKTFVTGSVRFFALRRVVEETQRRQRATHSLRATEILAFHRDGISRERKPD